MTARKRGRAPRHPAYLEGWDCHKQGGSEAHNPYLPGSLSHELWLMGYRDRHASAASARGYND